MVPILNKKVRSFMYNQTIAKLLAKEDITIQHGNYNTAWFDIENRVLGLPMWKDMGKDVYDLLIGHEVGHALYTPYEGWHDSPEKLEGAPRSYINVIEDARIERFIQSDYPGLVGPFKRGYKYLLESETFFKGIEEADWSKTKLIDKINTKAKLGNLAEVPFTEEEIVFYKRAMVTTTFDEVVQLCKDILDYTREHQNELLTNPKPEPGLEIPGLEELLKEREQEAQPPMGHDDGYPEEDQEQEAQASTDSDSEDGDESDDCKETNDNSSNSNDDETLSSDDDSEKAGGSPKEEQKDEDESITDKGNRESERDLLDLDRNGRQRTFLSEPNQAVVDKVVIPYKELAKQRKEFIENQDGHRYVNEHLGYAIGKAMEDFKPYIKQVRKSANFAIKEFEMRKAAFQWQRAATAKSGSLDVNQVHKYKYDEDIFARVTQLANAKNHGMMMLIDYSGSMSSTLGQVIDQLIHLVVFCKAVNIPFDVYAFTTGNRGIKDLQRDGEVEMRDVHMTQLISSSLKKKEYTEALEGLYLRKKANTNKNHYWEDDYDPRASLDEYAIAPRCEQYGSTPLNDCLILSHRMIRTFRNKHNVDKMNLIVLSDGDSNHIHQHRDYELDQNNSADASYGRSTLLVDKKFLSLEGNGRGATHQLLKNISKRYNCQTIGFFVSSDSYDWRSKLYECGQYEPQRFNKEYRKHKCVTLQDKAGYDEFYMVKGGSALDTAEDAFDIDSEASTARIRTAFKKYSSSKKNNKTLLTNFGKAVA
jgi:hypothetical protein